MAGLKVLFDDVNKSLVRFPTRRTDPEGRTRAKLRDHLLEPRPDALCHRIANEQDALILKREWESSVSICPDRKINFASGIHAHLAADNRPLRARQLNRAAVERKLPRQSFVRRARFHR